MGCCVSTSNRASARHPNFQLGSQSFNPKSTPESRAPPPPESVEEETVKEVLSETPKLQPPPIKNPHNHENDEKNVHAEPPVLDEEIKIKPNGCKNEIIFHEEEIISEQQVSEVCSLSMSETVSTTTFNNDYGDNADEVEVKQRVKRSPAARNRTVPGDFGQRRDRVVGKSPTRRTEHSPDKRNNAGRRGDGSSVRLVQSREPGTYYQAGRRALRADLNGKHPVGASERRSRSPAASRSTTIGRSTSASRTNGSPGRIKAEPPERGGSGVQSKWASTSDTAEAATNESLENPLVSLECFIFL